MFNNPPDHFKEGVHVQMLINRGIGNSNKGSRRWVNKLISTNKEEYDENVEILIKQQEYQSLVDNDVRLYASINPRNLRTSINTFRHEQIELISGQDEELKFYKNINARLVSALMQPENRVRKYYLIDIDTHCDEVMREIRFKIAADPECYYYKTPNGCHYICHPFDVRLLENTQNVEIKTDGLMLINTL